MTNIAIVADFNSSRSHLATNGSIEHSASRLALPVNREWIATTDIEGSGLERLQKASGIWIGPGSPYQSMDGALAAIRYARENNIPLLGTCGGFQHIIIEYARNVLGVNAADHEESSPDASVHFISRLACSLAGRTMTLTLHPGSKLAAIYQAATVQEEYLCNFGVNPRYVDTLRKVPLKVAASDSEGEIRAVELPSHSFFVGTLFLPQHRSTPSEPHPLITAFIQASRERA
jgi:CTP synthase (UTP-ammonia lyase)